MLGRLRGVITQILIYFKRGCVITPLWGGGKNQMFYIKISNVNYHPARYFELNPLRCLGVIEKKLVMAPLFRMRIGVKKKFCHH